MTQDYLVYRQEFKYKVAYFILTSTLASPGSYVGKNAKYIGRIHAVSRADAAAHLKERLGGALAGLDK